MLAGFIDALAGGGGLLTVPALLAAGMSPAQALATNKLQACGGSLSASLYFIRRKVVNLADQKLNILMTFIGSTSGALLVQHVQSDILRQILPILVICIGLYFLLMPKLGEEDRQRRLHGLPFALIAGGCVGFYDGFFGPAPVRFMRWRSSRWPGLTSPNRPPMPKCSTRPRTSAACCCLSLAARLSGQPGL
jgi:uncharacterized membrane protein YfcA